MLGICSERWAEQHETNTDRNYKNKTYKEINSYTACPATRLPLPTLFFASLASSTAPCPTCAASFVVCRTAHHVCTFQPFFFLFSPSLSSLPPPTPDGVDAAAFLPLFAVLEGTFTSGLHCVDTRPSAAKNVSPPGRAGPLVAAPCSARGPYGVLRWVLRMRNSGSQRSAILTARTLACTLSDTVQAIPQLARLLLQCHIPKNPQTCCKSARTCIYRCVVCSM